MFYIPKIPDVGIFLECWNILGCWNILECWNIEMLEYLE
jgi:hypothetical protein